MSSSYYPSLPKLPPKKELDRLRPFEEEILKEFKSFSFTEGGGRSTPRKGIWIREHLLDVGEDYLYGMFQRWRDFVETARIVGVKLSVGEYGAFRTYCWLLKKVGLIVRTRREPGKHHFPRSYYTVVEDELDNSLWENPYRKYL